MYSGVKSISELKAGDVVRSKASGVIYVVMANYGGRATAVRIADITNPIEWELFTTDLTETTPEPPQTEQHAHPTEPQDVLD